MILTARPAVTVAAAVRQQARRTLVTSSSVRGAAGHDDHHHGHGAQAEDPNVYTKESEFEVEGLLSVEELF
jgi:hypothetical protein